MAQFTPSKSKPEVFPIKNRRKFVQQTTNVHRITSRRDVPYYRDYISDRFLDHLKSTAVEFSGVPGLQQIGEGKENPEGLFMLCSLYDALKTTLFEVLAQRVDDREFIDNRCRACFEFNNSMDVDYLDPMYDTVIGHEDAKGRIVVGPRSEFYSKCGYEGKPIAPIPDHLKGPHVTMFGPPDSAKISMDAMNAFHMRLNEESAVVSQLLEKCSFSPKWGADNEDSKTPLRSELVAAASTLSRCFDGTLTSTEESEPRGLCVAHRSIIIKRLPGLSLPTTFLLYNGQPLPLHMYDFALHLHQNWDKPEALTFYIPKMETEEEARYLCKMFEAGERIIQKLHPSYISGTIRVIVVVENPRALFRINEIIDELHPFFVGTSLGWHDLLASTARLFKEDPNYCVPVKADPNIVIRNIVGSHHLLADVVGSRGGIKIGGMYGVLPVDADPKSDSFQVTIKGFFKDVITQLKRNLDGFWVAQPEFVRLGIATVEAWKQWQKGERGSLQSLISSLLIDRYQQEVLAFVEADDVQAVESSDPMYKRALLSMNTGPSMLIANNHPDEVRYNVFQSLQYLADWLSGNGNVALPALINSVPVRVMDDLATAERSRWEVWLEVHHGRFPVEHLVAIVHDEYDIIRKNGTGGSKKVEVQFTSRTEKWYPIALRLVLLLMTKSSPPEFATELLLPFTLESVRKNADPWGFVTSIDQEKYLLDPYVNRLSTYYAICPSVTFSREMAKNVVLDMKKAEKAFKLVKPEELRCLLQKSGDKEIAASETESEKVLWAHVSADLEKTDSAALYNKIVLSMRKHAVVGAAICITSGPGKMYEDIALGSITTDSLAVTENTRFEVASLSKSVGSCFAVQYFKSRGIPLTTKVNDLLATTKSPFRIPSGNMEYPEWGNDTTIAQCMSHSALNMHYVNGIPLSDPVPPLVELLTGNEKYGYVPVCALKEPGSAFGYSGGGHMVIEHLIESLEERSIVDITAPFLEQLGMKTFSFFQKNVRGVEYACGHTADGNMVDGTRQMHPAFAAGGLGTARDMAVFLNELTDAFQNENYEGAISHDTAVSVLYGVDVGSMAFMGAYMGLGIFIAEAGPNRIAIHQGANAGFRSLFMHCFHGPDMGKGFNMHVNAELNGVFCISEVAQFVLKEFCMEGVDITKFQETFSLSDVPSEQIVNIGYKELIFKAFQPDLPEEIVIHGADDPLAPFNLAVGGTIISATNQRFARASNMLSPYLPVFDPELFGRQGKIMDSWESVRHNQKICDVSIFELKKPSNICFVALSTQFHLGNQAESVSVDAKASDSSEWLNIIPRTHLDGHSHTKLIAKKHDVVFSHVRVSIYPDGGFSRIGLFNYDLPSVEQAHFKEINNALMVPFVEQPPQTLKPLAPTYILPEEQEIRRRWATLHGKEVDAASLAMGGSIASASNEHYGPAIQIISPYPPLSMFDGLETARSRVSGHFDDVVVKLGIPCRISRIEVDCTYFVNNSPLDILIEATSCKDLESAHWSVLCERQRVKHFAGNCMEFTPAFSDKFRFVRFTTFPDGGFNRVRVYTLL